MSAPGVEDEEILEVLRSADEPRRTTTEVADELPITRGRTRTRLQQLADDGVIEREKEGNEVVWWLPERVDEAEETDEQATEADAEDPATDEEPDEAPAGADDARPPADATETGADADDAKSVETPAVDEAAAEATADAGEEPAEAAEPEASEGDVSPAPTGSEPSATESAGGAGGPAEIEVEAVSDHVSTEGSVTDVDPDEPAARAAAGEGGTRERLLRAVSVLSAAVVIVALLRRLLRGGDRG